METEVDKRHRRFIGFDEFFEMFMERSETAKRIGRTRAKNALEVPFKVLTDLMLNDRKDLRMGIQNFGEFYWAVRYTPINDIYKIFDDKQLRKDFTRKCFSVRRRKL